MAQEGTVERACDRCRERRVKCDKRHPACLRCEKLGKPCPGYDKKRKFVDESVNLRKKYLGAPGRANSGEPASPAETDKQSSTSTPRIQGISSASAPARRRLPSHGKTPSARTSVDLSSPASLPSAPWASNNITGIPDRTIPEPVFDNSAFEPNRTLPLDDLNSQILDDANWMNPWFDAQFFDLEPSVYYAQGNNSCGFVSEQPNIIDEVDRVAFQASTEVDPEQMSGIEAIDESNLWRGESQKHTSQLLTDEREHEQAFLIRHFAEAIGPWMDLFDSDKHFGHLVPLKALRDAMLRNAIAAVAAKQLARVGGSTPFKGLQSQSPARMEVFDDVPVTAVDWFYKAANYYDKAIACSRMYIQALSGTLSNPPTPSMAGSLSMANTDDLLVAVSIFSMYEYLDNLETGWMRHLSGMKSLLNVVGPCHETTSQDMSAILLGHRASFWNFARADYQAAYINRRHTLLDAEDLQMWKKCGLQVSPDGSLYADAIMIKSDPGHQRDIVELVTHTLLWIILKVVNFASDEQNFDISIRQVQWGQLVALLDQWYSALPDTFQPCAQIKHPMKTLTPNGRPTILMELFFSIDACAAAVQLYHFAQIVLLLSKPTEQNVGGGGRLRAYREIAEQATHHARQVCGIALGRPNPAVRVEMLLPLYVAGSCFEDAEEQQLVTQLLRAIEKDTGCATESRIQELQKSWGLGMQSGMMVA